MLAAQVAFGHFGHGQKLPGCWQHLQAAALLGAGEGSRGSSFMVPLHNAPGASGCKPGGFLFFSAGQEKSILISTLVVKRPFVSLLLPACCVSLCLCKHLAPSLFVLVYLG